jgi:hypothetical protein
LVKIDIFLKLQTHSVDNMHTSRKESNVKSNSRVRFDTTRNEARNDKDSDTGGESDGDIEEGTRIELDKTHIEVEGGVRKGRKNQFFPKKPQPIHLWVMSSPELKEELNGLALVEKAAETSSKTPFMMVYNRVCKAKWDKLPKEEKTIWVQKAKDAPVESAMSLKIV